MGAMSRRAVVASVRGPGDLGGVSAAHNRWHPTFREEHFCARSGLFPYRQKSGEDQEKVWGEGKREKGLE
jgi:hypothetical protein